MASFVTAARVRCPNQAEIASEVKLIVTVDKDDNSVHIQPVDDETGELSENPEEDKKSFKFNHVFGMNASGGEVYAEMAKPLLETVLEGCNANFSVVGQAGGGKTYTLAGGVLPALSKDLFAAPQLVSVDVSYVEVHAEKVLDLLNPDTDLTIREQPGYGVYVSSLTKLRVENEPELMKLVDDGELPRQNSNSSTILTLFVRSRSSDGTGDVMGKFQLVEYCAYEPDTQNQMALEAFGEIVSELSKMPDASRRNHLDFQDSNLTWLLKESLGGNCKSAFLGALSPSITCYQQTIGVLNLLYYLIPCKGGPMPNVYPQYNFIKQVNNELQNMRGLLEAELEIEDEDAMISKRWIESKALGGHDTAIEYLQKEKFLQELGASEAEKAVADKEKKNKRVKSMRKFKTDEEPPVSSIGLDDVADAPIIEEEDTRSEDEEQKSETPATTTEPVVVAAVATEQEAAAEATPEKQQPVSENGVTPSSALVAAAITAPTTPSRNNKQLSAMNEQDLVDNSPRAKIHTYADSDSSFGVTTPSSSVRHPSERRPKICLDHLGVDVPSEEQLQEIFKIFDPSGDGKVSLVEFRSVFRDAFENYGAPMEDRDVDRLFAKFDTGVGRKGQAHDGFLSYQEFCILVLNRLRQ